MLPVNSYGNDVGRDCSAIELTKRRFPIPPSSLRRGGGERGLGPEGGLAPKHATDGGSLGPEPMRRNASETRANPGCVHAGAPPCRALALVHGPGQLPVVRAGCLQYIGTFIELAEALERRFSNCWTRAARLLWTPASMSCRRRRPRQRRRRRSSWPGRRPRRRRRGPHPARRRTNPNRRRSQAARLAMDTQPRP